MLKFLAACYVTFTILIPTAQWLGLKVGAKSALPLWNIRNAAQFFYLGEKPPI